MGESDEKATQTRMKTVSSCEKCIEKNKKEERRERRDGCFDWGEREREMKKAFWEERKKEQTEMSLAKRNVSVCVVLWQIEANDRECEKQTRCRKVD